MASQHEVASQYWGYLIKPDKSPAPVFEQLLLGVANYINKHVAPWDTKCLTPAKLAHFYRLVGGDYDVLFLHTPSTSLSFIYQSIGCFHTLQPDKDPFYAPSVPALTPAGFIRWQVVQLLLDPDEHVPFLQAAVKRFDLVNPTDGEPFPSLLPKGTLPSKPDQEMTRWHATVSEKLMLEAQASQDRNMPPRPTMALSDGDMASERPTSADSLSIESQSIVDAASYFQHPRSTYQPRAPQPAVRPPLDSRTPPSLPSYQGAWSPLHQRGTLPRHHSMQYFPSSWPAHASKDRAPSISRPTRHVRTPSTLSSSSCSSDSSSVTSSSASLSPRSHRQDTGIQSRPQMQRRSSMGVPLHRPMNCPIAPFPSRPRQPAGKGTIAREGNGRLEERHRYHRWASFRSAQACAASALNAFGSAALGRSRTMSVGASLSNGRYMDPKEDFRRGGFHPPSGSNTWR